MLRSRLSTPSLVAIAFVALLAALSLVAWRQGRALESLAALDRVERERSLAEADRAELFRRIQHLESRGYVGPEAGRRLGMHTPSSSQIVYLAGGEP